MQKFSKLMAVALVALPVVSAQAALVLKLDSANLSQIGTGGTAQTQWLDTSGNVNKALSNGWWDMFAITSNATPTGQSAMDGSAAGNYSLKLTNPLASAAFTSAPTFTFFAVYKAAVNTADHQMFFGGASNSASLRIDQSAAGATTSQFTLTRRNNSDAVSTLAGSVAADGWHVLSMTYDGVIGAGAIRMDGTPMALNHQPYINTFLAPISEIGSAEGNTFKGQVAAIYMYDTVLSDSAVSTVESGMAATYTAVPEPTMLSLVGLAALGLMRRR